MRKAISLFTVLVLLLGCVAFVNPTDVQAEQSQKTLFSIGFESKQADGTAKIVFSSDIASKVTIYEKSSDYRQVIFEGFIQEETAISNIVLNKDYSINAETEQGELFVGTFSVYDKAESDFIGIMFEINKIERSITAVADPDDDRMVMVEIATEVEKNNNFKTANKLFGTSINGKIESKTDVDFYQTMFYSEGDVTFLLENIPARKDFDLYVFDSSQKQIASSCSTSSIESIVIKDVKLNDLYYVKVVGYNNSFDKDNFYTLSANHTPRKTDNYGHTIETAKVATALNPTVGQIMFSGDSNYFKFTPSETGTYIINTTGVLDTYGYLYNQNKKQTAQNDDKPNDLYGNFEIKKELVANKVYYIQVKHYSTGTGSFNLNIAKEGSVPNTPINTIDNPTVVSVNQEYLGIFEKSNSENWFSFTAEITGSYKIYSKGNADTHGVLYDSTKSNVIIENHNVMGTNSFELANTLLQGKTYFIKVTANNFNSTNTSFNLLVEKLENPNDEFFGDQWGLLNSSNALDVNILPAWQYAKGNGFKIGVADSGTYNDHSDLANNINFALSYNFLHDMKDVFPISEPMHPNSAVAGHGTHVSGIIGADTNNGIGVAGLAPDVSIVPLKVVGRRLLDSSVYTGSIAAFVNSATYAQENDINVINCSFGGTAPFVAEQEAMFNANDLLFVIAAGNSSNDLASRPEYPACYGHDNSLVVASLSSDGNLSGFSNYGGPTDIAAPGDAIYGTFPYDSYGYSSGTSMSTPFVSAVAGLVWSNNSSLSPVEVKGIVTDSSNVTRLNGLNNKVSSGGLLNAFKAITADNTGVSIRSVASLDDMQRSVFGRDIKASIAYYQDIVSDELKTSQIIVKFADGVDVDAFVEKVKQDNTFGKFEQIEYLELINAYVFEVSSVDEADTAVNLVNSSSEVVYAEINYLRELN